MTDFRVVTEQLAAHAVTLDGLGGELHVSGAMIGRCGHAAAETPADGALSAAASAWVRALEQSAHATQALAVAVANAAECYAATDANVMHGG